MLHGYEKRLERGKGLECPLLALFDPDVVSLQPLAECPACPLWHSCCADYCLCLLIFGRVLAGLTRFHHRSLGMRENWLGQRNVHPVGDAPASGRS